MYQLKIALETQDHLHFETLNEANGIFSVKKTLKRQVKT